MNSKKQIEPKGSEASKATSSLYARLRSLKKVSSTRKPNLPHTSGAQRVYDLEQALIGLQSEHDGKSKIKPDVNAVPIKADGPGGKKYDAGKLRWDLIPFGAIKPIVQVITFGCEKYGANNWQQLLSFNGRYFAAMMRHLVAWRLGEIDDPESGLPHLAHAGCCLLFLASKHVGFDPILDIDK